ncbi:MAG TPA: hypothetical protein VN837_04450 [Chloroflexota bacterium]|nr:hypothetical protein [Chloroflexota bacterium]
MARDLRGQIFLCRDLQPNAALGAQGPRAPVEVVGSVRDPSIATERLYRAPRPLPVECIVDLRG